MNRLVKICFSALIFLSLVSCSSLQFKYSALNYASSLDGIYRTDTTVKVPKVNYFNNGFNFYSELYFNNYNRYSWQYPYYGWNYHISGIDPIPGILTFGLIALLFIIDHLL